MTSSQSGPLPAHPLEVRERGFQLYCKGRTSVEIGEALAVPSATVAGWSSRGKWKARRKELQTARENKAGTSGQGDTQKDQRTELPVPESLTFEQKQSEFRENMAALALKASREMMSLSPEELMRRSEHVKRLADMGAKALDLEKHKPAVVVNVGLLARPVRDKRAEAISLLSDSELPADEPLTLEMHTGCHPVNTTPEDHATEAAKAAPVIEAQD